MNWYEEKYQWGVKNLPEKTTKEQWDKWYLEMRNHVAWIEGRRYFLGDVLAHVNVFGIDAARQFFNNKLDESLSMDRPNEPGYQRAAND